MTPNTQSKIFNLLDKTETWSEAIPDSVVERAREKLQHVYEHDPESIQESSHLGAWVAGALHRAMMEETPANKLTVKELANRYDVPEQRVGDRSRSLRNPPQEPPDMDDLPLEELGLDPDQIDVDEIDGMEDMMKLVTEAIGRQSTPEHKSKQTDSFKSLLDDISLQIDIEGQFDFQNFFADHSIAESDQDDFMDAAHDGVEEYLAFVHTEGTPVEGTWGLKERLATPSVFGYVAYEILTGDFSGDLQETIAKYTLALTVEASKQNRLQYPFGSVIPVVWLTQNDLLSGEALYDAIQLGLEDRHALMDLEVEDVNPLWQKILLDEKLRDEQKLELINLLFDRAGQSTNPHFGPQLLKAIHEKHEKFDHLYDQLLEKLLFIEPGRPIVSAPKAVRKQALLYRGERSETPMEFLRPTFDEAFSRESDGVLQAIAKFIRKNPEEVNTNQAKTLAKKGLNCKAKPRREFFKTAYELGMDGILEKAANDRADSIQDWAEEKREQDDG